ncbi:hypothetical protein K440DRAFT_295275 [Wilcoxina mikolae CBS 423.85]|nr:hypothetical protein K440DRAFT_295275 [Wilcoxina mikolae CBS 423.85]
MAPSKSLPPAKLSLVLQYFRTTSVAYTLKDLEKSLPSAAGISSMTVKDYLAALVAESLLCVEKIGSGNWYWSFPADAKRQKEAILSAAIQERDKARSMVDAAEKAVAEEKHRLSTGDEDGEERVRLAERLAVLQRRREELKKAVEAFSASKGAEVVVSEAEKLRLKHNELITCTPSKVTTRTACRVTPRRWHR